MQLSAVKNTLRFVFFAVGFLLFVVVGLRSARMVNSRAAVAGQPLTVIAHAGAPTSLANQVSLPQRYASVTSAVVTASSANTPATAGVQEPTAAAEPLTAPTQQPQVLTTDAAASTDSEDSQTPDSGQTADKSGTRTAAAPSSIVSDDQTASQPHDEQHTSKAVH